MPPSADETIKEINRKHYEEQKKAEQKNDTDNQISMFKED